MGNTVWAKNGGDRIRIRHRLAKTLPTTCALCGEEVSTDDRWDVDHIVPIRERPDLAFEMDNVRVAHALCNRRRGAGLAADPNLCMKGHRLEGDNVRIRPNGRRACRQCERDRRPEHQGDGPAFGKGERLPTLLERGRCIHGHSIVTLDDVQLIRRRGHDGQSVQVCRACKRERRSEAANRATRPRGTAVFPGGEARV